MKTSPSAAAAVFFTRIGSATARIWLPGVLLLATWILPVQAAELQTIPDKISGVVAKMAPVRHSSRWKTLNLSIGLPLRDRAGLTNLLEQLYDPASANYHHFLTPDQFSERFAPTEQDYQAVLKFARAHGLTITAQHSNRTLVSVRGKVADVERAFHIKINEYQHPIESRTFYAPNAEPSIDLAVPVLAVGGLDDYVIPRPCLKPIATGQAQPRLTGSGPNGAYVGNDFRAAYVPNVSSIGRGQTVGLLEFDSGYYQGDITAYENLAGLPNVPVTAELLDGYNGGPGGGNDEVSLDIEMAISMAPGLKGVVVYEGSTTDDILNRMATDNLAKTIGASWTYPIDATSEQIFQQFAAQGQSFFNASGDGDAYPAAIDTPADDPNITIVGGTTLTTTSAGGAWAAETVWNWGGGTGSSGGISTRYAIPIWQQGINMSANQGSTTMRNLPDVALTADNVYVVYGNGKAGSFGGTSCATPLWAAFTALVNELALTNGEPVMGFLNPSIYAMGKGSNTLSYQSLFHDITTGNNESSSSPSRYSAVPGYDLCTGWGAPSGSNLINALALPEPLRIAPAAGLIFTGPVGGPISPLTQTYSLTNYGKSALNWGLANTSLWLDVSPASGTLVPGESLIPVTLTLTAVATKLPAGGYATTLFFTNLGDHFIQSRQVTLAVVTPPVITAQPANEALLVGMTANFSVSIGTNALMYYQWQENGVNLGNAGRISGTSASTLTISNIALSDAGAYSVILSNAAGMLASSNATLTIVPSAPVIVLQPTNESVLPDAPASFSVAAVGNTPYVYHWQFNGANLVNSLNISGATTSELIVSNAQAANTGIYSVIVSNSLGSVISTGVVLSLIPVTPPGISMSSVWSFSGGNLGEYPYSGLVQGRDGNFYGTTFEGGVDGDGTVFRFTVANGMVNPLLYFNYNNGALPYAGLCLGKDGNFYGTTEAGGTYGDGSAFRINTAGTISSLAMFDGEDGLYPVAGLAQGSDGNFYGTANEGGDYGYGTIFRMTTSGTLTPLVSMDGTDGVYPSPVLVQGSDGSFYGTAEEGGTNGGAGTVFKMTPAGILTVLYSFSGLNDGAIPIAGLVQGVDGSLYGTTYEGGANGYGTIFKITPSGVFTVLYEFTGGSDGGNPWGGLVQAADGNLYGTTEYGGTYSFGTVFQIAPGGALNTVVQFDGYNGATPSGALVQGTDGNLYGTTQAGGTLGDGTVFKISTVGPLQITAQPADATTFLGGSALFTVATSGSSPVAYQWQQDGIDLTDGGNISGSTTATLRITNAAFADAALYTVVVSNAFNSLVSDPAVLELNFAPPYIITQPASQTLVAGTTATFSVTAGGNQPLSYQWQDNGTNLTDGGSISGSATSTLTISGLTLANSGAYSVIVSNDLLTVTSLNAVLVVDPPTSPSVAQAVTKLFTGGADGAFPYAGLIQGASGALYGTTEGGGFDLNGTIYHINLPGGAVVTQNFFPEAPSGLNPYARLVQGTNGNFYGTTFGGGTNGYGTIYKLAANGALTFSYSFTGGSDGADPENGLVQGADGNFYGASYEGGAYSVGSIYRMTPNGAVTPIYAFTGLDDGAYPLTDLVPGADGKFYGTTEEGGENGFGTVFSLTTNGTLTTLVSFDYSNGAYPEAGVIQGNDGDFYGTTFEGGTNGYGTVYRLGTNGALTTLGAFAQTNGSSPAAALTQGSDGNFYGTTYTGGVGGHGTAFKITTNGLLTTLIWFDGLNGASPVSAPVQAGDGNFYGTTPFGGTGFNASAGGGYGTVYQLTVPIFTNNTFRGATAIACLPYAATLSGKEVAPAGDVLSYARVSGPDWLNVASSGVLLGTPTNSDIGTNIFVVSLSDTNGVVATANMDVIVAPDPAPTFVNNPFTEPWANEDQNYAASLATNATAPYIDAGDILTFAKLSGPDWLEIAGNGALSGTPEGLNTGSNTFLVSVTDLGGASNTTTLFVYVDSPPVFEPGSFTKPNGTPGIPYTGTIATNAIDPDAAAGDILTFYKVTGPDWLNVATNGALSGTPTDATVGANSFLLLVVNSGGLSGIGFMDINITAANPPVFMSNPFSEPPDLAGQVYAANIATNASDLNPGDQLTFTKISGPGWLSVAGDGSLSGMPLSANAGTNSFAVSVTDLDGQSTDATLLINVSAIPVVASISEQGGNLLLSWSGGVPPYQIQTQNNPPGGVWQNLGGPVNLTNQIILPTNAQMFYRIQGQ